MHQSAYAILKGLIKFNLLISSGHEYSIDNLEFACHIDRDNEEAKTKYEWAKARRRKRLKTVSYN